MGWGGVGSQRVHPLCLTPPAFGAVAVDRYLRCRAGDYPIGPDDVWGVCVVQVQEFTVLTTVNSSRRGILGVLGSIGGAYSIVYVPCSRHLCQHRCWG
jgi:hypothetical protein